MKKVMVFVAVPTIVSFVFGAMAVAQKTTTTPAEPALAPKVETFSGAIVNIDPVAKTFDVKGKVPVKGQKEEKVMTFATDDKTKITLWKEVNTFGDLKVGSEVDVAYNRLADKNLAVTVNFVVHMRDRGSHPITKPPGLSEPLSTSD